MALKNRRYITFLITLVLLIVTALPAAAKSIRLGHVFKHPVICIFEPTHGFNIADLQKLSLTFVEEEDEQDDVEELSSGRRSYSQLRLAQSRENTFQEVRCNAIEKQYRELAHPYLNNSVATNTLPYYYTFLFRFTPF